MRTSSKISTTLFDRFVSPALIDRANSADTRLNFRAAAAVGDYDECEEGGVESVACRQTECERAARRGGRAASTANHGTLVAAAVHSSRAVDWILHRPLLGILIPTFSVGI